MKFVEIHAFAASMQLRVTWGTSAGHAIHKPMRCHTNGHEKLVDVGWKECEIMVRMRGTFGTYAQTQRWERHAGLQSRKGLDWADSLDVFDALQQESSGRKEVTWQMQTSPEGRHHLNSPPPPPRRPAQRQPPPITEPIIRRYPDQP